MVPIGLRPGVVSRAMTAPTIWVLGDQLDAEGPAFAGHRAGEARVLMVESRHAVERLPFNRERRVLVIGAMRRFADRLRREGWAVDLRQAPTFAAGVRAHCDEHRPDRVVVAHPSSVVSEQNFWLQGMFTATPTAG